jgi:hypothetical protein
VHIEQPCRHADKVEIVLDRHRFRSATSAPAGPNLASIQT